MPGNKPPFLNQLTDIWARLDKAQRFSILLFGLVVLAGLGALIFFMNRVEYEVLYRDLNPEDAQAIAGKLKEEKKDFQVQGTSILVAAPKSEVDKLRLEVAGSGLARSGRVGYEIFDKSQFGMTDFTEQVNLQRALEGELARTIASLSEISEARVHIVLPKDSVFDDKKEEAKASVVVRLRGGAELSKSSIAGIKGVVAGAVPGLKSYGVSIVDDQGRLLSQSLGSADGVHTEMESGIREQLEREMVTKVISILEPIVGKNKVHANSSIDLDFNSTEQTEESFNPNPPIVLSQQKSEERVGGGSASSGIPGTQSNKSGAAAPSQETLPDRVRQSEVTNYEVSKLVRHTVQPKGTIRRLSVAVILDHKTTYAKGPDGKITTTSQARSQQELDACRELVLAAVGYDKERGDTVTLENVPFFNETRPDEEQPPIAWHVKYQPYLLPGMKYVSFLLLFLLVYMVLFRPMRKRVFQHISGTNTPQLAVDGPAGQLPADLPPKAIAGQSSQEETPLAAAPSSALMSPAETGAAEKFDLAAYDDQIEKDILREANEIELGGRKYAILKNRLAERARTEPEMVSQLIRSWILEKE